MIYNSIKNGLKKLFLNPTNYNYNSILNKIKLRRCKHYSDFYDLSFFNYHYSNYESFGALQKDEALLIYSIIRVVKPKNILELGFHKGHSAFSIINAISTEAKFSTLDIDNESQNIFNKYFKAKFKNANFYLTDMQQFDFKIIASDSQIDFVFIDAVHDFEINVSTFINLKSCLSENAIIVVHDTGIWRKELMKDLHFEVLKLIKHKWLNEFEVAHQIDERRFVNYLIEEEKYTALHFHSNRFIRQGLSILSKGNSTLPI